MKLARTEEKTIDGNIIVVPNKHIVGEIIHTLRCKHRGIQIRLHSFPGGNPAASMRGIGKNKTDII